MTSTVPGSGRPKPVQDAWARYMINVLAGFVGDTRGLAGSTLSDGFATATAAAADAASALTLANNAQTAANGRNTVMYATSAPTVHPDGSALINGDLWYKTSGGNIIGVYQRASGAWTLLPIANDAIFANIDAGKITVGTLSGINLIGNFIETQANVGTGSSPSVVTGVLLNSSGNFYCYANTGPVLAFVASTGQLTVTGPIVSGGTITGATLRTASSSTRVEISSSNVDRIYFYDSSGSAAKIVVALGQLQMASPAGGKYITLSDSFGVLIGGLLQPQNGLAVTGGATVDGGLTTTGNLVLSGTADINYANQSNMGSGGSTAGPLLRLRTSTGNIIQDSSSRRFKQNIATLKPADYEKLLALQPRRFRYRDEVKANPNAPYEWGLIAEEAHDAGLDALVHYRDGKPQGLAYERMVAPLLGIVRDLRDRLEALERNAT